MIDIRTQKVNAMKALRDFCATTFGTTNSIKADKEYIERLQTFLSKNVQLQVYQLNALYMLVTERLRDQQVPANSLAYNERMILQEIVDILNAQILTGH